MVKPGDVFAIVDAYSSGKLLAPEFNVRGFRCTHVASARDIPASLADSFSSSDFIETGTFLGSLDEIVDSLRRQKVRAVLPGTETGVELADELCIRVAPDFANGVRFSKEKRDKHAMVRRAEAIGLRVIRTMIANDAIEIIRWRESNHIRDLVLKPVASAGGDQVRACQSDEEIRAAVAVLTGYVNRLGIRNEGVIVQERIRGTEYVVDTVSCGGKHRVVALWRIERGAHNGRSFICESTQLLPQTGGIQAELTGYCMRLLDGLGLRFGPAHCELMRDENGVVLLELGARMHGAGFPRVTKVALEETQTSLTVSAYVDPERFAAGIDRPYTMKMNLRILELIANSSGTVQSIMGERFLKNLPSFHALYLPSVGDRVVPTIDVFTSPGWVALGHSEKSVVDDDYSAIRGAESRGELFELR